jgi:FkbM family methyltransferase
MGALPPLARVPVSQLLPQLVGRPDPLILDVGCNDGGHTRWFTERFPRASVHAFEPDPRPCQRFRRTVRSKSVKLWNVALCAEDGEADFHMSSGTYRHGMGNEGTHHGDWDQSGSLRRPRKHLDVFPGVKFDQTMRVRTMRLDTFIEQQKIDRIDLIWADVQGAEADLIAGGAQALARTRLLYTEYNEVEMYEGQLDLRRLLALLPDFEVVARYPEDVLLTNRRPG